MFIEAMAGSPLLQRTPPPEHISVIEYGRSTDLVVSIVPQGLLMLLGLIWIPLLPFPLLQLGLILVPLLLKLLLAPLWLLRLLLLPLLWRWELSLIPLLLSLRLLRPRGLLSSLVQRSNFSCASCCTSSAVIPDMSPDVECH